MTWPTSFDFDFRFHADRSEMKGTQYFEFVPGPYQGRHWVAGARFVHEYTFCLIEGIFEARVPGYDHYGFVDVARSQWGPILQDLASLEVALNAARSGASIALPYGRTWDVRSAYELGPERHFH